MSCAKLISLVARTARPMTICVESRSLLPKQDASHYATEINIPYDRCRDPRGTGFVPTHPQPSDAFIF